MTHKMCKEVSFAVNLIVRHGVQGDVYIPSGPDGFVYADDVSYLIGRNYRHRVSTVPNADDILYMIAASGAGRFQASAITHRESGEPIKPGSRYTILARGVQGHSGEIGQRIDHDRMYGVKLTNAVANDVTILVHHTWSGLVYKIVGRGCPGLLPGGGQRTRTASILDAPTSTVPTGNTPTACSPTSSTKREQTARSFWTRRP